MLAASHEAPSPTCPRLRLRDGAANVSQSTKTDAPPTCPPTRPRPTHPVELDCPIVAGTGEDSPLVRWFFGSFAALFLAQSLADAVGSGWPLAALLVGGALYILWRARTALGIAARAPLILLRSLLNLPLLPWYAWALRHVARTHGQTVPWWKWPRAVVRPAGDLSVHITRPHLLAPTRPLRISVSGLPNGIGTGVEIKIESVGHKLAEALGAEDVATGDADFDRRLLLIGPNSIVLAALDADTRRVLLHLAKRWNLRIADDQLQIETRRPVVSHRRLLRAVQDVTDLARRAASRGPLMERLCDNALHDPIPEVRINNLEALARDKKRSPEVLRAALSDPSEKVRLRAALWLGTEGRPVLLALATSAATSDECAAEAIRGLREALSEAKALALLESALSRRRHPVVPAALEALGLVGSVAAVPPLRAVIESHPLDFAMKRAADEAIARIQSRLEGAEAGQLAVAEGDAGQLTLADSAAGRLSLDRPAKRESA
jgi:hypothetical protein